jgi:putative ABC transport system permease protein
MIFNISWKNIWRNKLRSGVVIGAMILGVWALLFLFAFSDSITNNMVGNSIKYDYSHIQLHNKAYKNDPTFNNSINGPNEVETVLAGIPQVASYSERLIVSGMVGSANSTQGAMIYGIDPEAEASVTYLDDQLAEGTYFTEIKRNPIVLSQHMAEKLKVRLGSKVVLTFQDSHNNITAGSFRIEGIIKAKSPRINEGVVFVRKGDLEKLTDWVQPQEIGIVLQDIQEVELVKAALQTSLPALEVASYKDLAPDLEVMTQQTKISKTVLMVIIMLALVFGIINTMLMAVLERTKEIGMLMAIGMKRIRVFTMIMIETILISLAGAPLGMLMGYLTIVYFSSHGFDFSAYAASLEQYGIDSIIYLSLDVSNYFMLAFTVVITAVLGAVYPARKATKLKPVEALRKL